MRYRVLDFQHLSIVGECYWKHLHWCLYSTLVYSIMIPIALIHGFFPMLLANVPDNIMAHYYKKFNDRRTTTGQAERNPVE